MYFTKESLCGNAKSKFILIRDSPAICSAPLVKSICKLCFGEGMNHLFVHYETVCRDSLRDLGFENFKIFDAVSDPCGWNERDVDLRSLDALEKEVEGFRGLVCVDSLSPLLIRNGVNPVYKALHRVLKGNPSLQLLATLHRLAHTELEFELLERLATTVISFTPEKDQLALTVRYASGKVKKHLAHCEISDSYDFTAFREAVVAAAAREPSKKPDPTANLTFNLKLKSSEIEARSQLVLPHTQVQKSDIIEVDEDLYEEEDPDDDLDI